MELISWIVALSGSDIETQLAAARKLKNSLIGQDLRKEDAVRNGIIKPLVNILSGAAKASGKRKSGANGANNRQAQEWTPEDDLTLQAALIISSLASAGRPLLVALVAADVPGILVETLAFDISPRLVTIILQAIRTLTKLSVTVAEEDPLSNTDFWPTIFNPSSIEIFDALLRQRPSTQAAQTQIRCIADVISSVKDDQTCRGSANDLLADSKIIDTLASLIVAHAIKAGHVRNVCAQENLIHAPPTRLVPSILNAISAIVGSSTYRNHRFILSASLRELFTKQGPDGIDSFGPRQGFDNGDECLLPPLHIPQYRTISHMQPKSANFPALRIFQEKEYDDSTNALEDCSSSSIDHCNALCGLLLVFARSLHGTGRLAALRLLALSTNALRESQPGTRTRQEYVSSKVAQRERQLAVLAVSLTVAFLSPAPESRASATVEEQREAQLITGEACAVLAILVSKSKDLQIAAVEARVLKPICSFLRKTFDSITLIKPMWSPRPPIKSDRDAPKTCRIATDALPWEVLQIMKCRQAALDALAAIAASEDTHKQYIIEQGVMGCFMDSLKPFPGNLLTEHNSSGVTPITPKDGNTASVIVAACNAIRALSRSVSVLRTSLIDAGIVKPLLPLLHHPSLRVKTAATDVFGNLVLSFSPMRSEVSDCAFVKTVAEHARSDYSQLQLSSLWTLVHFVEGCPRELKIATFDELGSEWIINTIQGEQRELSGVGGVSVGLSTSNAAGEQVDILNPSSMDVDTNDKHPSLDSYEGDDPDDKDDGEELYDETTSTRYQASQIRSTLAPASSAKNAKWLTFMRDQERSVEYESGMHDVSMQAKALDLLRNMTNGEDCSAVFDTILQRLGTAKILELLTSKLLPLPRSSAAKVYQPTEVVLSTMHVVVHIANGGTRHRHLLVSHKPLLQAMLPHFAHLDARVRVCVVWAVISMTWVEDDGDKSEAKQRVQQLRAAGIEHSVQKLQDDKNLDVKERVKTALRQFETLSR